MKIGVIVDSFRRPFREGVEVAASIGAAGIQAYATFAEDWGGETACIPVSAATGAGIQDLLERIVLEAEVMELKANPNRRAKGAVVEARLDKGQGTIATHEKHSR